VGRLTRSFASSVGITPVCDSRSHDGADGIEIHPVHDAHSQVRFRSVLRQGAQRGRGLAGSSALSRDKGPDSEDSEESIHTEEAGTRLAWLEGLQDVCFPAYRGRRVDTPMNGVSLSWPRGSPIRSHDGRQCV